MTLARKAVRGAAWTIGSSVGGRLVGVVGTLVLTRFLAPDILGQVGVASVLVLTAAQFSSFGLGQYIVAKPDAGRAAVFHATVYSVGLALLAFAALALLVGPLSEVFEAPDLAAYIPGLIAAALLDRVSFTPQRVLLRDMRFKFVALTRSFSELVFTGVGVGLAASGWGGEAIVIAGVVRSGLRGAVFLVAAERREWLEPSRLDRETSRRLLSFGLPISLGAIAGFASKRWDNLLFSALFGPAVMGLYNLAYNLADIPAEQVGEHIGDVLLPSFAHMPAAARPHALVRSTSLLALVIFPLAVGLATVADPLVEALFNQEWQGVAPFLIILSVLSVVRPIGWTITSYLQACDRPRHVMVLAFAKLAVLLSLVGGLGQLGPAWACAGVGFAYGVHALASLAVVQRLDGIRTRVALAGMAGPLAASGVMAACIAGLLSVLERGAALPPAALVGAGVLVGALVYVPAAFLLAPRVARDCWHLLSTSLRRA